MGDSTSSPEKLIYEGHIEIDLEGINIGKASVKVYEGAQALGASRNINPYMLTVKAVYNEKKFEITSNEGGIDGAIEEMKQYIQNELKKGR
ncbi:MAG: hypothetical protein Kow00108_24940 [Calditrichia bacterium]